MSTSDGIPIVSIAQLRNCVRMPFETNKLQAIAMSKVVIFI